MKRQLQITSYAGGLRLVTDMPLGIRLARGNRRAIVAQ